jgi:sn-glycerol 3-phosphate transport system permease protein
MKGKEETSKMTLIQLCQIKSKPESDRPLPLDKLLLFRAVFRKIEPWLYIAPVMMILAAFVFYPLLKTICMSSCLVNSMGMIVKFTGLENYAELFNSQMFRQSLFTTVYFVLLTVPATIIFALILGLLAENKTKCSGGLGIMYAVPMAVSSACTSIIWMLLFNPTIGVVNYILKIDLHWLSDPKLALIAVAMTTVWTGAGFNFIYMLAGLKNISRELYESANIDGANYFQRLFWITLPCLSPTLFFLLIMNTISAFQTFAQVNIMTQGGPAERTNVLSYVIYKEAFFNNRWGFACAQSIVFLLLMVLITLLQFRSEKKGVFYQ